LDIITLEGGLTISPDEYRASLKDGLILREDMACPYIADGRAATLEFVVPSEGLSRSFDSFLAAGFRRSGSVLYRNVCRGCRSCLPLRIETEKFAVSRSQRRTLKNNRDVKVEVRIPAVTPEKDALYRRYILLKHETQRKTDGEIDGRVLADLHCGYRGSLEMDYFLGDALVGVGIVDTGADSLSSVYFYYDPGHVERRLGVFSVLQEIFLAQLTGRKYYYLGFYIEETPKMSYKKSFRPNQVFRDGQWETFAGKESGKVGR
jgi:arginyl-tRNA--protein-N-Asp/Glu arginylyltransferase